MSTDTNFLVQELGNRLGYTVPPWGWSCYLAHIGQTSTCHEVWLSWFLLKGNRNYHLSHWLYKQEERNLSVFEMEELFIYLKESKRNLNIHYLAFWSYLTRWKMRRSSVLRWVRESWSITEYTPRIVSFLSWRPTNSKGSKGDSISPLLCYDFLLVRCREPGSSALEFQGRLLELWQTLSDHQSPTACVLFTKQSPEFSSVS